MTITATTITDEQIAEVWRDACGPGPHAMSDADTMHLCTVALNHHGDFTTTESDKARARCAEILNGWRAKP